MAASMADAFAAMGELVGDAAWGSKLHQRVADILGSKEGDKTSALAKIYFETEREIVRRSDGEMSVEIVREKLRPAFAQTAEQYPAFSLIFLQREKQFIALHAVSLRYYAAELAPVMGRLAIDAFFAKAFTDSRLPDVRVSLERGLEATGIRFQSLKECVEAAYDLYERWYAKTAAVLGTETRHKAFERAFRTLGKTHGFLPTYRHLLGATPLEILPLEKAVLLHELEMETSIQAQDIRSGEASLRLQAQRLRETIQELEGTKLALEQTSKARSEFIDVVAHQFRTPLSSMRWNGELLVDEFTNKGLDPALMEAMQNIRIKSVFLIETLDRVFTTLDIETGHVALDLKPVFFWEVLQDATASYERDIAMHQMKLVFKKKKEQLKEIKIDKVRIFSVMKIILGNAVMYGKEGGEITVDLEQKKINGREYMVASVKDQGIGIDPKDLSQIFEKFYRTQAAIHHVADGTGLGMFIVKNVVEAHGGMAWVESEGLGKGATIYIALPLEPVAPEEKKTAKAAAPAESKYKRQTIL